jgi:hypothetical protein
MVPASIIALNETHSAAILTFNCRLQISCHGVGYFKEFDIAAVPNVYIRWKKGNFRPMCILWQPCLTGVYVVVMLVTLP